MMCSQLKASLADGVDAVALAATGPRWPFRPADLDDPFAELE